MKHSYMLCEKTGWSCEKGTWHSPGHKPYMSQPPNSYNCPMLLANCWKAQFSSPDWTFVWFVTLMDVQENWTRKFQTWHVPTSVIGSCVMFVWLQNTSRHEVSQGAKRKQGIVAQSLSGWQSTVFCILYEYMQIYVWDVNKVTFIHHC